MSSKIQSLIEASRLLGMFQHHVPLNTPTSLTNLPHHSFYLFSSQSLYQKKKPSFSASFLLQGQKKQNQQQEKHKRFLTWGKNIMGTLVGHVAPGFAFLALGLWHLLNHIKLHSLHPNSYTSSPWFPTSKTRYIELFLIMIGSSISMAMELVIGPEKHQPFDTDGTIPSNHLHNFEHATISLTFFTYAAFAIVIDIIGSKVQTSLTQFIAAIAFGQQLLLFHLHSADHMGVEGQYHLLLQIVVLVCLVTTLMGIGLPKSFLVSFVRSASILFQGVWLMLMGYMLWTPEFIPKGCYINDEEGHQVVRCHGEEALHRAKSLVNLQFSWFLVGVTIFSVSLYLVLDKIYGDHQKVEYSSLTKEEEDDYSDDVESQSKHKLGDSKSFLDMGKSFTTIDMER